MIFNLEANFTFSGDISFIANEIEKFVSNVNKNLGEKYPKKTANVEISRMNKKSLLLNIVSHGNFRPHNALLQIKNSLSKELGKKHHIGIREIEILNYEIEFELEQQPLKEISIPFAEIKIQGKR